MHPDPEGQKHRYWPDGSGIRIRIRNTAANKWNCFKGHGNEAYFCCCFCLKRHTSFTLRFEPFRFWIWILGDIRNKKTPLRRGKSASRFLFFDYDYLRKFESKNGSKHSARDSFLYIPDSVVKVRWSTVAFVLKAVVLPPSVRVSITREPASLLESRPIHLMLLRSSFLWLRLALLIRRFSREILLGSSTSMRLSAVMRPKSFSKPFASAAAA